MGNHTECDGCLHLAEVHELREENARLREGHDKCVKAIGQLGKDMCDVMEERNRLTALLDRLRIDPTDEAVEGWDVFGNEVEGSIEIGGQKCVIQT
jgi:hypothetical protein